MGMEEGADPTAGKRPQSTETPLYVVQSGSIQEFLQRRPAEEVKGEQDRGQLQRWEVHWPELLKMVEAPCLDWEVPPLPGEPTPWDDVRAFLASFEQVAKACRWPREEWAARLLPALSGEAERAFFTLAARDREDYGKVRAAILHRDSISREKNRQHFRHFCYQEAEGPRGAYSQLQELCHGWLKVERHSKEQILELLILEQFLAVLPVEVQSWVRKCSPETCFQAVALAEDFLLKQQESQIQENQALTPFDEVAASVFEAGQALPEVKEMLLCVEARQRGGGDDTATAGKGWLTLEAAEDNPPDYLERVEPCGTSMWKAKEIFPQCPEQEITTEDCPRATFQKTAPGERVDHSVPYGRSYQVLQETIAHRRIPTGRRQNIGSARKNSKRSSMSFDYQRARGRGKPYKCVVCGQGSRYRSDLIVHQRIHTGERPYECLYCGKSFPYKCSLNRHYKIHTGEKPYACPVCGQRFSSSTNLSRHQRIHT
ncbi:zinc finger and SCAN domain-containing protein 16-like isoform X2 [Rhineura floridana]|nr:zinc finger and SCAN domain-containing protein 16-like isoform X2 [Rhineura floridana]XP_061478126.1 zinc finger and SCAN domain-containing protein 16-like isoform X2 [Rhineura floridana]XP_061478127.1 zinc finger and SCAN domain-containing protein 16-like isoform X2 [Rhineura floridana]XP_061478128.1 zinc finger and SCAN domain-containing protein 16-like isoform X2 [Rhineura floridana]XP_061478129.1 zinc finger and SCAN domain-containing protein 16-like isoform X2 [Rhineura floridana]